MMNLKIRKITAAALLLAMLLCAAGCGSSSLKGSCSADTAENGMSMARQDATAFQDEKSMDYPSEEGPMPNGNLNSLKTEFLDKANVKLIYSASMTLQTEDFEKSAEALQSLAAGMGGYIENSDVYYGGYYGESRRRADYTVRIPVARYTEFLNAVGESCHVTNLSQNVQNIGLEYSDAETRLQTLKTKHERLLKLLSEANVMSDIIELETALADCEYQMDGYSSTLKRYDSLVDFSTVNVSLMEVTKYDESVNADMSFGARLMRTLRRGMDNFLSGLEDFVMFVSYNLVTIAIAIVIFYFVGKAIAARRDPEKTAARLAAKAEKKAKRLAKREGKSGAAEPNVPEDLNKE